MAFPVSPLVLSLGDPCGIGPEIIAKAWLALRHKPELAFCVIGDSAVLAAQGVPVAEVADISDIRAVFPEAVPVLNHPLEAPVVPGQPDSQHARHIIDWIAKATTLCRQNRARGLVTAPIAKSVLYAEGFSFPGHTEFLAELCRDGDAVPKPVMMLAAPDPVNDSALRVVLATIHLPLSAVPGALTSTGLADIAHITHAALLRDFGIARPRIVMAGLNPHAGEGGSIGREEIDTLSPTALRLQAEGLDISGPFPADSLFHQGARARYDAALCMYHDQGLIPLKTLDFWGGVNITLGLPIVRTSPDHGTGFDIAGKGLARADSLINAIVMADSIARNRQSYDEAQR